MPIHLSSYFSQFSIHFHTFLVCSAVWDSLFCIKFIPHLMKLFLPFIPFIHFPFFMFPFERTLAHLSSAEATSENQKKYSNLATKEEREREKNFDSYNESTSHQFILFFWVGESLFLWKKLQNRISLGMSNFPEELKAQLLNLD